MDYILIKGRTEYNTTAQKSILKLVNLQCLVAMYGKDNVSVWQFYVCLCVWSNKITLKLTTEMGTNEPFIF